MTTTQPDRLPTYTGDRLTAECAMYARVDEATLRALSARDRLDWLVDRGLLKSYFGALEMASYEFAVRCRESARKAAPKIEFMVYAPAFPATWFHHGLLRGLGTPDRPVIVLTYEGWSN